MMFCTYEVDLGRDDLSAEVIIISWCRKLIKVVFADQKRQIEEFNENRDDLV